MSFKPIFRNTSNPVFNENNLLKTLKPNLPFRSIFDPHKIRRDSLSPAIIPHTSISIRNFLETTHIKTRESLNCLKFVQSPAISKNYRSIIKRVEGLVEFFLMVDEVREKDLKEITNCEIELTLLKNELKNISTNENIQQEIADHLKKEVTKASEMLIQLNSLVQTVIVYQEMQAPILELAEDFCDSRDKDPLDSLANLKSLLQATVALNDQVNTLSKGQSTVCLLKLNNLHEIHRQWIEDEVMLFVDDVEDALKSHVNYLDFYLTHKDPIEAKSAEKQANSLLNHLQTMRKEVKFLRNSFDDLPECLKLYLDQLHDHLISAKNKINPSIRKYQKSEELVYGTVEWQHLVASRPSIPQGLIGRIFSYLNPLKYISEEWRPTAKQLGNLFFLTLLAGQEFCNLYNRYHIHLTMTAKENQLKEEALSEEAANQLNSELNRMQGIFTRDLSKLNLSHVTKNQPLMVKILNEYKEKYPNQIVPKAEIEKAIQSYRSARIKNLPHADPNSNPYKARWNRVCINSNCFLEDQELAASKIQGQIAEKINVDSPLLIAANGVSHSITTDFLNQQNELSTQIAHLENAHAIQKNINAQNGQHDAEAAKEIKRVIHALENHSNLSSSIIASKLSQLDHRVGKSTAISYNGIKQLPEVSLDSAVQNYNLLPEHENIQLINDFLNIPIKAPTHAQYGNLIGILRPEIKGAKISGENIEGIGVNSTLSFLMDTQKAYFQALESHQNFSSNCRGETCHSLIEDSTFPNSIQNDYDLMKMLIEKMEFAVKVFNSDHLQKATLIGDRFNELAVHENFFFPVISTIEKEGKLDGHSLVLEIEKDHLDKMILRLFDLNDGTKYHARLGETNFYLPFYEIVNIDPKRMAGGAFTSFLAIVQTVADEGLEDWDVKAFYKIAINSLGGEITSRKDSSQLFKERQLIDNCAVASTLAIIDKNLMGTSLAERMRSLTFFRATKAYCEQNKNQGEAERTLGFLGIQTTLESIQRAIEVGGFTGSEGKILAKQLKDLQNNLLEIHSQAYEKISLSFSNYQPLSISLPKVSSSELFNVTRSKQLDHGQSSQRLIEKVGKPKPAGPQKIYTELKLENKALIEFNDFIKNNPGAIEQLEVLTPILEDSVTILGHQQSQHHAATSTTATLKITELLAQFSTHTANYFNQDFLAILQQYIHDPDIFQNNLDSDKGLIKALAKLCDGGRIIGYFVGHSELEGFFTYLTRIIQKNLENASEKFHDIDLNNFPNSQEIFSQIIADSNHEMELTRLQIIHLFRLRSFELHTSLSLDETADILTSINYLHAKGFPKELTHNSDNEIKRMWHLVKSAQHHFNTQKNANKILNTIARGLEPDQNEDVWQWYDLTKCYVNSDKTIYYHPDSGRLEKQTLGKSQLPDILKTNPLFISFVGSEEDRLDRIKPNAYIFQNSQGFNYQFVIINDAVKTQREFKGEWYQALPAYKNIDLNIAQEEGADWYEGGVFWYSLDKTEKMYFTGHQEQPIIELKLKSTNKYNAAKNLLYSTLGEATAEFITPSQENSGLMLVNLTDTSLSSTLSRLENIHYVFAFSKNNQLSKIILSRLGLTFSSKKSEKEPLLTCNKLYGFGIASGEQSLPLFGDFTTYLYLKKLNDGIEENGILIPFRNFTKQETGGLKTPTKLAPTPHSWKEKIPYFFYQIKGHLLEPKVSTNQEAMMANLFLATIFLSERRYEEASKYLQIFDKVQKSVSDHVDKTIIEQLINFISFASLNQDHSPNAAALRLQAAALIFRLNNLNQINQECQKKIPNLPEVINADYGFYGYHVNKVNVDLRLSQEQTAVLSRALNLPPVPKATSNLYPLINDFKTEHPELPFEGNQNIANTGDYTFEIQPHHFPAGTNDSPIINIIASQKPRFVMAFPENILPLYRLLENPVDIGNSTKIKIAHQFGLDSSLSRHDLKTTMISLLELRYRFVVDLLTTWGSDHRKTSEEKYNMQAEVNLIGALLSISKNENISYEKFEEDVASHSDLAASIRTLPSHAQQSTAFDLIMKNLKGAELKEALRLWKKWVVPNALPIPLSAERAKEVTESFVGPIHTRPLLNLMQETNPPLISPSLAIPRPATILFNATFSNLNIESCFTKIESKREFPPSPFALTNLSNADPVLAEAFKAKHDNYNKFLSNQTKFNNHYTLVKSDLFNSHIATLNEQKMTIDQGLANSKKTLLNKLNKKPQNPSLRQHRKIGIARKTLRELTIADAKAALAKGWDFNHLNALNRNLSSEDGMEIFQLTLKLMLEQRESQRIGRSLRQMGDIVKGNKEDATWQINVAALIKSASQKANYDPYEDPILLLAETEFDIELWPEQIPAIKQLAPKEKVAALVELAMGLGKTDIITPAVLCLLADGKTLVIYVTPEALVPTTAANLQQRINQAYQMEVRVIPIDREVWTAEKIHSLKVEFTRMIEQRIPLIWSATDLQTLINSCYESIDELKKDPTETKYQIVIAWQDLFRLLLTSAESIGDEIHAIMDILTSYNFSLGNPMCMAVDEMDAVIDFIKVVLMQPEIDKKGTFPFLGKDGKPLNENDFNNNLSPKIIKTLLERGITNDPRCKELVEAMDKSVVKGLHDYLSSKPNGLKKTFLFPNLYPSGIKSAVNLKGDALNEAVRKLLPSDRKKMKGMEHDSEFAKELDYINGEYQKLNERFFNFLAVQKESLRSVFSYASTAQLGKHYVLNKQGNSAIPADNGTPLWDSQFGKSIVRLYFTTFLFAQIKIPEEVILADLNNFVEKHQDRIQSTFELSSNKRFDVAVDDLNLDINDDLIKEFGIRYGKSCRLKTRAFTKAEIEQLVSWVNEKFERQLPFIRDYYLPEQKIYPSQIETSTHMFPIIVKPRYGLKGTTGTLYNKATYPYELSENNFLSDTSERITERIKSSSLDKASLVLLSGNPEEWIDQLYNSSKSGPGSIIDMTGYLQKDKTELYARAMLEQIHKNNTHINHVVYYEGDVLKVISEGKNEPSLFDGKLPAASLAALWEVAHTTGSNILINQNSHALLLVGKHVRFFELLQASMRARGLGSGQKLEFVVLGQDFDIITDKLSKYLGITVVENYLTVDQIIQYALFNEVMQETENNWNAIEMRMRMALLTPLWNEFFNKSNPKEAIEIFNIMKTLVFKNIQEQPWDQYGYTVSKTSVEEATKIRLKKWLEHPIFEAIKIQPKLCSNINTESIKKELRAISEKFPGPLQTTVDSELQNGQKTRTNNQIKDNIKNNANKKVRERIKTRNEIKFKKTEQSPIADRNPREVRRQPYTAHPHLPLTENVFAKTAHQMLTLKEIMKLSFEELNTMSSKGINPVISAAELLGLDPNLSHALKINESDILFSLNLATLWQHLNGISSVYTPYYFFQLFASHALLIQDRNTHSIKLKLVDLKEAEEILQKLKDDRNHPEVDKSHEVNLSLYHLTDNRMISSGTTPVNPNNSQASQTKISELVTQAKLLSGISQYTKEEGEFLAGWMRKNGRKPREILNKFIFKIAVNREETLKRFLNSNLSKIFQLCGIRLDTIKQLLSSPMVENIKNIQSLLFDTSLSNEDWLNLAHQIKNAIGADLKTYMAQWSNIVVPLLPVLFDIQEHNGAASFRPNELDAFDHAVVRRRWLMNIFFPTLADTYTALKTAVPHLSGKLQKEWGASWSASNAGKDADFTYLEGTYTNSEDSAKKITASEEQLEALSELLHPIWGLPLLADSASAGEFKLIASHFANKGINGPDNRAIRGEAIEISSSHNKEAILLANQAINGYDLTPSLKKIKTNKNEYEFQRLYGLFSYLSKQDLDQEARGLYALYMLPEEFSNTYGQDRLYYSNFIPDSLAVAPGLCSADDITTMLNDSYENAKTSRHWIDKEDPNKFQPTSQQQSSALKPFAKNAPSSVAAITAKWLNQGLGNFQNVPWVDLLLLQLLSRKDEVLIDHQAYNSYFEQYPSEHMTLAGKFEVTPNLTPQEIAYLNQWRLVDFDLFTDLAGIQTLDKPALSLSDLAGKWGAVFEVAPQVEVPKEFWHKILGKISEGVKDNPPVLEEDKAKLRRLVAALDVYSQKSDETFNILQAEIGNIRLAADYSFNMIERQQFGFEEIKKLPSHNPHTHKIFNYFIPNFLLKAEEAEHVNPEALSGLFFDLHKISNTYPKYSLDQWDSVFGNIMNAFTIHGITPQKNAFFTWSQKFLNDKPKVSELSDSAILAILQAYPDQIEHKNLIEYVEGREQKIIALISSRDKPRYPSDGRQDFIANDFHLFSELYELGTLNRQALSYDNFAKRLIPNLGTKVSQSEGILNQAYNTLISFFYTESLPEAHLKALNNILKTIIFRTAQVSNEARNKPIISQLIKALEIHFDKSNTMESQCINLTNELRLLSDYSDLKAEVNVERALEDLFATTEDNFRGKSLKNILPNLIVKANNDWFFKTFKKLVNSFNNPKLTDSMLKTLDYLLEKNINGAFLSSIDEILHSLNKQSVIIDHILLNAAASSGKLKAFKHSNLKNYLNHHKTNRDEFLNSLGYQPNLIKLANGNYDVLASLDAIKTKDIPVVTQDITKCLSAYFLKTPYSLGDKAVLIALQTILNTNLKNNVLDNQAVSVTIGSLEKWISNPEIFSNNPTSELYKSLSALRLKVDLTGSPEENLSKTIKELCDPTVEDKRKALYPQFIKEHLIPKVNIDAATFEGFLTTIQLSTAGNTDIAREVVFSLMPDNHHLYTVANRWLLKCDIRSKTTQNLFLFLLKTEPYTDSSLSGRFFNIVRSLMHMFWSTVAPSKTYCLKYTEAENLWNNADKNYKSTILNDLIPNNKNRQNVINFRLMLALVEKGNVHKIYLENIPELNLLNLIQAVKEYISAENSASAPDLCGLIVNNLPIENTWTWSTKYVTTVDEKKAIGELLKTLRKVTRLDGPLSLHVAELEKALKN